MPEALLKAAGLERSFGSGEASVYAVRGVDLQLDAGERLLVMGPSGSGKTTLVSMLGGLLTPSAGQVFLDGEDLYEHDERARAHLRLDMLASSFRASTCSPPLQRERTSRFRCAWPAKAEARPAIALTSCSKSSV